MAVRSSFNTFVCCQRGGTMFVLRKEKAHKQTATTATQTRQTAATTTQNMTLTGGRARPMLRETENSSMYQKHTVTGMRCKNSLLACCKSLTTSQLNFKTRHCMRGMRFYPHSSIVKRGEKTMLGQTVAANWLLKCPPMQLPTTCCWGHTCLAPSGNSNSQQLPSNNLARPSNLWKLSLGDSLIKPESTCRVPR